MGQKEPWPELININNSMSKSDIYGKLNNDYKLHINKCNKLHMHVCNKLHVKY